LNTLQNTVYTYLTAEDLLQNKYVKHKFSSLCLIRILTIKKKLKIKKKKKSHNQTKSRQNQKPNPKHKKNYASTTFINFNWP